MTIPSVLPDWAPWWVQLVLLVAAVLVVGAYGVMPFSVFGVKARLEAVEERLDEIQSDIRALTNRLPDPEMGRPAAWRRDDEDFGPRRPAPQPPPPAPEPARGFDRDWDRDRPPASARPPAPLPPRRSEPQLNWPENRPRS